MGTATTTDLLCAWRAAGPYLPTSASKNGLIAETRLFLQAYRTCGSVDLARTELVDRLLPQRSRETRRVIVRNILARLTRWHPPAWVLDDLVAAAEEENLSRLRSLLLMHHARQETLLYDTVQELILPQWLRGEVQLSRDDVLAFLAKRAIYHPELARWSYETRLKIAGNLLTTLRDYGLLTGRQLRRIVEPTVDALAFGYVARLLREEGIAEARLADHADWRLWLMSPERVRTLLYE
ncbi:MAG: DUF1819 family protein [Candidatus Viridilinea halotolerans]|uniref:DUF1819 family protein n=1 Tax=Candidatus Viridilinea halotolerans TaxID=2491704 RepID=A0A426U2R5_9CHLR|nr:MAG: DUF1819 family protein [Candidatus Viridilinea halotolerans]